MNKLPTHKLLPTLVGKPHQRHIDRVRPSSSKRGYGSKHRQWRHQILNKYPICVMCGNKPATQADHIIPINKGGKRFDINNGQGLCASCHSAKTVKYDGGFGYKPKNSLNNSFKNI